MFVSEAALCGRGVLQQYIRPISCCCYFVYPLTLSLKTTHFRIICLFFLKTKNKYPLSNTISTHKQKIFAVKVQNRIF